jgi:hypothetical protein
MTIRFRRSLFAAAHLVVAFGLGGVLAVDAVAAERSFRAEVLFRLANPCPATGETRGVCRGYVIDRVVPHVCGGAEEPANMRWLTVAEAQAKSRWDRIGCRPGRKLVLPGGPSFTEAYAIDAPEPPVDAQALPE